MALAALALGLVMVVEGLVLALLPRRLDDLARLVAQLPLGTRRALGLGALALGVGLVWMGQGALMR